MADNKIITEFIQFIFRVIMRWDVILMLVSALIGWGISHVYYAKTLNDLKAEVEEQKRINALILKGIESIGKIKYSRDASGNVTGVVIELKGSIKSCSTVSGELTVDSPSNVK